MNGYYDVCSVILIALYMMQLLHTCQNATDLEPTDNECNRYHPFVSERQTTR